MTNIKKIVVLNINSRYFELLSAKIIPENGAKEDIKTLGIKEHSGIVNNQIVNEEIFETTLKEFVKIIKGQNIDKVFVGIPSSLCRVRQIEKERKILKPFKTKDSFISELENEIKKELNNEIYSIIDSKPTFLTKDDKPIKNLDNFDYDEIKINYSLYETKTDFVKLVKRALINTQIIQDVERLQFIPTDLALINTLYTEEQRKNQYLMLNIDDYATTLSYGINNLILSINTFNEGLIDIEKEIYFKLNLPKYEDAVNMLQSFDIMRDGSKQFCKVNYKNQDYNVPCEIPSNIAKEKLDKIAIQINQILLNADYEISRDVEILIVPTRALNLNGLQNYLSIRSGRRFKIIIPSAVKQNSNLTCVYSILLYISNLMFEKNTIEKKPSIINKIKNLFSKNNL